MSDTTGSTPSNDTCLLCRKSLGKVTLRVISGEIFCEEDAANVITYGLIGAACRRQMDLALHAMSHKDRDLDGLYTDLTGIFRKYGLIDREE